MERLTPAEREPTDSSAEAESESSSEAAAEETDKRRPIERPRINGTWTPAPSSADESPASVVKWREAPRRVVNPGPAPWRHPTPIPVAVRGPANVYSRGVPNGAVVWDLAPRSIVVKVGIANRVA